MNRLSLSKIIVIGMTIALMVLGIAETVTHIPNFSFRVNTVTNTVHNNTTAITNITKLNRTNSITGASTNVVNITAKTTASSQQASNSYISIPQEEDAVFGMEQQYVILKVLNVQELPNGYYNLTVYDQNNGRVMVLIEAVGFGTFKGVNGNITLPEILKVAGGSTYVGLYIANSQNIEYAGLLATSNNTIIVMPNAAVFYIIAPGYNATYIQGILNDRNTIGLIATSYPVYDVYNAIWGWSNQQRKPLEIILPSEGLQLMDYLVNISDMILNTNTTNPGIYGFLPIILPKTYSTFTEGNYTGYIIKSYYMIFLATQPLKGYGYLVIENITETT